MRIFSVSCLCLKMVTLLKPAIKEDLSHKLNGSKFVIYRLINGCKTHRVPHNKPVAATAT